MTVTTIQDVDAMVAQSYADLIDQLEAVVYALKNYQCDVRKGDLNVLIENYRPEEYSLFPYVNPLKPTGKRTFEINMEIYFWPNEDVYK